MRSIIYIIVLLFGSISYLQAEIIHTIHGTQIEGKILLKEEHNLILEIPYGTISIDQKDILKITNNSENKTTKPLIQETIQIKDKNENTIHQNLASPPDSSQNQNSQERSILKLHDFETSEMNLLNQAWGSWEKDSSDLTQGCSSFIVYDQKNGIQDKVLKINYDVKSPNPAYNGIYSLLNYEDLSSYNQLELWIRGEKNHSPQKIKIEIKSPQKTASYYIRNISHRWEKFIIPFNKFREINDWTQIKEFVIVFEDTISNPKEGIIYIDDIQFSGEMHSVIEAQKLKEVKNKEDQIFFQKGISNQEIFSKLTQQIFLYFWNESDPQTGLTKDRNTANSPASIAATGYALTALGIGINHGWITENQGYQRAKMTLETLLYKADHEKGYFYHFLNPSTAKRASHSEVSSIDTALLLSGILYIGEYFKGSEVNRLAKQIYYRTEWNWMLNSKSNRLYMGWTPEEGFLKNEWKDASEQMILYILGLGSPTNPLPESIWSSWNRPVYTRYDKKYIGCPGEPMFVYMYSHGWIDFRNIEDQYTNYWDNSVQAILANREFCKRNSNLDDFFWGASASDGPTGYKAYGAKEGNFDGTIAPYCVLGSVPFVPNIAIKSIQKLYQTYGDKLWGKYGFKSAYNPEKNWFSNEYIGIDQGISLIMLENFQNESIWNTFMEIPYIQKGLTIAKFKKSEKRYLAKLNQTQP